jgi:hypothetical protein
MCILKWNQLKHLNTGRNTREKNTPTFARRMPSGDVSIIATTIWHVCFRFKKFKKVSHVNGRATSRRHYGAMF